MPASLKIISFEFGHGVGLAISGEIDLATAPQLDSHVDFSHDGDLVVLDFSEVSFMDSTGLRSVVRAHEDAGKAGKRLAIVASDNVQKLLQLTGLVDRLDVHSSRASAVGDDG